MSDFPALTRSSRGPSRSDATVERRHRGALSVSAMPSRTDISGEQFERHAFAFVAACHTLGYMNDIGHVSLGTGQGPL
jgi:hypothetical protein